MVVAIIPIKTNNQRLPGKNTRNLGSNPLFHYIFTTAKSLDFVDEVWVDSSDTRILESAKRYGFKCLERPTSLNSPETSGHDLLKYEIDKLNLGDRDIVVQLFATLPFIKKKTIDEAVNLVDSLPYTSVLSLYPIENRFWYDDKPVGHDPKNLKGTQYERPVYCEAGSYTFEVGAFKKENSRITEDFIRQIVHPLECIDIDTEDDFRYAEMILANDKKI
jgi:CMP-N-acetylneuraminic acid synthetase